jgi:hypothetical protein
MPLTLAAASVPLAVFERMWWVFVAAGLAVAVGRYVAWRRAAVTALATDETALVQTVGGRQVKRLPWDDISTLEFHRGVARPRWTVADKGTMATLPTVVAELERRDYHGARITEWFGSLLILDVVRFEAAATALSAECTVRGVRFHVFR